MLLVPVIVVAAARSRLNPPAVRVIELYQGLVRPFQRRGKACELRCGQLSVRTIAASADRHRHMRRGRSVIWLIHVWQRSSYAAEVRPF
jgi:hypothetical protein